MPLVYDMGRWVLSSRLNILIKPFLADPEDDVLVYSGNSFFFGRNMKRFCFIIYNLVETDVNGRYGYAILNLIGHTI